MKKKKQTNLKEWTQVDNDLYFYKDEKGIVWQLLRTSFKKIPKCNVSFEEKFSLFL